MEWNPEERKLESIYILNHRHEFRRQKKLESLHHYNTNNNNCYNIAGVSLSMALLSNYNRRLKYYVNQYSTNKYVPPQEAIQLRIYVEGLNCMKCIDVSQLVL